MQKCKITIVVQAPVDNEAALLQDIITYLQNKKTQGAIDLATVTTDTINVPQVITI